MFADFFTEVAFTSNTITFTPKQDLEKGTDYSFWVYQAVQAPSANDDTGDAFTGETTYKDVVVDTQIAGTDDYTDSMYAQLQDSVTEDTTGLTLTIWPNLKAEKAHYSFEFSPAADIGEDNEIWIQFEVEYFDFFIADTLTTEEGAKDEDEEQLVEMTCLVKNKDDTYYKARTSCQVKRNTVRIEHEGGLTASDTNPVVVELVGVTNPNTDNTLTFKLWVMDYGSTKN